VRILALLAAFLAPHGCPGGPGHVAYVRSGTLHLVSLADCRDRVLVRRVAQGPVRFVDGGRRIRYGDRWVVPVAGGRARAVRPTEGIVSPDGRLLAQVRARRKPGQAYGTQAIWVVDRRGVGRRVWLEREDYRAIPAGPPGPIWLAGWSPGGRWILFYIDPMGSGSIAADGLELQAVPARGGKPKNVVGMLAYRDYLTWCGSRLVVAAGGSRIATENKRLVVASAPSWRPRELVHDPAVAWASPACVPGGARFAVLTQEASHDPRFVHAHWSLWSFGLDGSRRRLSSPPRGQADESPRWIARNALLFVRRTHDMHGLLMLWRGGRIVGPFVDLGRDIGYYGHHDWWQAADWHR
jgi:hypothetical protein